jgi:L-rhamnose-H+ transport protein
MNSNPELGIVLHWLGGLASASFYLPYRQVKRWNWENYWIVGGFFSWIFAPIILASLLTKDLFGVLMATPASVLFWTYIFGLLWGFGGLTFGLTMRYLGISLGMSVALGLCAAFGTLIPPIFEGTFQTDLLDTLGGKVVLLGVFVCLGGIGLAGMAGMTKEGELPEAEKRKVIKEFSFNKGMLIAIFSGIMSACFSFAIEAAKPINLASEAHQTEKLWTGLPALVVILLGGFTTNFIWCLLLNIKNGSFGQYLGDMRSQVTNSEPGLESVTDAPAEEMAKQVPQALGTGSLFANYALSAAAGVIWYFQFFFYQMGTTQMGIYHSASWTLHMASIMIFSTLWGLLLLEWKGCSLKVYIWLALALTTLVGSTIIIGYGTSLKDVPASVQESS